MQTRATGAEARLRVVGANAAVVRQRMRDLRDAVVVAPAAEFGLEHSFPLPPSDVPKQRAPVVQHLQRDSRRPGGRKGYDRIAQPHRLEALPSLLNIPLLEEREPRKVVGTPELARID